MKPIVFASLFVTCLTLATAQTSVPPFPGIRVQGTLTDNSGNLVTGTHNVTLRIYKSPTTGVPIYTEVYNNLVLTNGILDVLVGAASLPYDSLYYMETQLDNEVFSPRTQLGSTPYALHAFKADTATYAKAAVPVGPAGGALTGSYPNPSLADSSIQFNKIAQNGAATGQVMKWNGTGWIPANDSSIGGLFLPLTGGVLTGAITSVGNPTITMGKGNFGQGNINGGIGAYVAGTNNRALGDYSNVNGGGGGSLADSNAANSIGSTVGGGTSNVIDILGDRSTIGGGAHNRITGSGSCIGGGANNTITGIASLIAGGSANVVTGGNATICGGGGNVRLQSL